MSGIAARPALHRMIHAQADAVERMAETDLTAPAEKLAGARRVFLVGTGTSRHAAELGVMMLADAGVDARWASAAQFARWGAQMGPDDAVVVITHTAETAFALRCREQALAAGARLVSLTGIGSGWPDAIETVEREQSETYTVSYTAALAVLAGLAHRLGAAQYGPRELGRTAAAVRAAFEDAAVHRIALPARVLAVIGAGPWAVTAREGALKIREASRTLAEGFEAEHYLHGSAVPFGAADGLLLLEPAADPDGLVAALGAAAQREGIAVSTLEAPENGLPPVLAQLPMTVRLQLLAARFADVRRQNPDVAIVGAWAEQELWTLGAPTG
ncbi:SIS domain-containing protein [Streptomyces sp. NPDC001728]|uniref:SIS domain-containing protein n=1 Tax=Streptomyces sp. NPDC001728 TaxID=3154396 RepID=UPI0033320136